MGIPTAIAANGRVLRRVPFGRTGGGGRRSIYAVFVGGSGQRHPGHEKCLSDKQKTPNCVGENISPPLAWSNAPEGTKSFALLLLDPEGRAPAGV